MWIQNVLLVIISFGGVHLITGCLRAWHRYSKIKKYQYDYYDAHPMNFIEKVGHHLGHGIFEASTFYFSITLIVMTLLGILVFQSL